MKIFILTATTFNMVHFKVFLISELWIFLLSSVISNPDPEKGKNPPSPFTDTPVETSLYGSFNPVLDSGSLDHNPSNPSLDNQPENSANSPVTSWYRNQPTERFSFSAQSGDRLGTSSAHSTSRLQPRSQPGDRLRHGGHSTEKLGASDHSSEKLDRRETDKSTITDQDITATASVAHPCFRTCLCHTVEKDSESEPSSEIPGSMIPVPDEDKSSDIEFHENDSSSIILPGSDKPQWIRWESREHLHVECNSRTSDKNNPSGSIDPDQEWYQEMSGRLYDVSEVEISQATSFELPSGLCEMEGSSEVKQLTWTRSSFKHLHYKPSSTTSTTGSTSLTACLPLLTSLKLNHNQGLTTLSNLQPLLARLPSHLQDLTLSYNNISVIPASTFPHPAHSIHRLDLSHNKLSSLDVYSLTNLTALRKLDLSFNQLIYLHNQHDLTNFWHNMEYLDLRHNSFEHIPSFLKLSPQHSSTLGIRTSKGTSEQNRLSGSMDPDDIINPPMRLSYLDLSHNRIEHLEAGIFTQAVNLQFLDLSSNLIHSIPAGVFTQSLSNLGWLHLGLNHLSHLPPRALEGLNKLQMLNLSHNLLQVIQGSEFTGKKRLRSSFVDFVTRQSVN